MNVWIEVQERDEQSEVVSLSPCSKYTPITNSSTKSNYCLSNSDERMWDCPFEIKSQCCESYQSVAYPPLMYEWCMCGENNAP
jgi:hypothetical protein